MFFSNHLKLRLNLLSNIILFLPTSFFNGVSIDPAMSFPKLTKLRVVLYLLQGCKFLCTYVCLM